MLGDIPKRIKSDPTATKMTGSPSTEARSNDALDEKQINGKLSREKGRKLYQNQDRAKQGPKHPAKLEARPCRPAKLGPGRADHCLPRPKLPHAQATPAASHAAHAWPSSRLGRAAWPSSRPGRAGPRRPHAHRCPSSREAPAALVRPPRKAPAAHAAHPSPRSGPSQHPAELEARPSCLAELQAGPSWPRTPARLACPATPKSSHPPASRLPCLPHETRPRSPAPRAHHPAQHSAL